MKAIILGDGPAGISAALYIVRGGIDTVVISKGAGALEKAEKIENYYGFAEPLSGSELYNNGRKGAERLGVKLINDEITSIDWNGSFVLTGVDSEYKADAVVLATGAPRKIPAIKGITEFEGRGVSYCAACDAFFYRGKDVAVIGSGEFALHEANALAPLVSSVTVCTNGESTDIKPDGKIKVNTEKIAEICGTEHVEGVAFTNGEKIGVSGAFIALGVAGSAAFARKIGAFTEGNRITVDENMMTNVPGLFAAGDCTGGLLQVCKAVYEGGKAGTEAVKFLRKAEKTL